jgi:uncharacterized protein YcfJ
MNRKTAIRLGLIIGSTIGGVIPMLWGSGYLSFSSVIFSALGAMAGVYAGFKLGY